MVQRYFIKYILISCALIWASVLPAQQIMVNANGEKIIVFEDGSWRYFTESDAALLENKNQKENVEGSDKKMENPQTSTKKQKKKKSKYSRSKRTPAPTSREEYEARQQAIARAERAAAEELRTANEYSEVSLKRAMLEKELEWANDNVQTPVEEIIKIEKQLALAKKDEKRAKNEMEAAEKNARLAEKMITMSDKKRRKLLAKMDRENAKNKQQESPEIVRNDDIPKHSQNSETDITEPSKMPSWRPSPNDDVMLNPPQPDCEFAFEGVDEFSGKRRRDMTTKKLFSYTNEKLRPYMKERDYITCEGYISSTSGGFRYLTLHFVIASDLAQREFGVLEKGAPFTIRFIDGSTARLYNNKTDIGFVNPVNNSVEYRASFVIDSGTEKELRKNEVDKLRVQWGTGYEDYEIYDLDFFADQLECLSGK